MKLTVHDVGHGLCVSFVHDNGNVMLWDCGHSDQNRPSEFLPASGIQRIDRLFVTNYDEDHLSDLPNLRSYLNIPALARNQSITADQLRSLKLEGGPISAAMKSMLDMIDTYTFGPPNPPPAFPGVTYNTFRNNYGSDFNDTNNISLVTFLEFGSLRFIIPGDLEEAGWRTLLTSEDFRSELARVSVFIAPHHGRRNGYCQEVFNICQPGVVIFSDSPIKFATQEMAGTYGAHASGVNFNGEHRSVLTTRKDGPISWIV